MFPKDIYVQRRKRLIQQIESGLIFLPANEEVPMNYPANLYHFRQDSSFLYYAGIDAPGLAAVIDIEEDRQILFGDDISVEDIIWTGPLHSVKERGKAVGINESFPLKDLRDLIKEAITKGRRIHLLPPYRVQTTRRLAELLGIHIDKVADHVSEKLIRAIVDQRSVKSDEEVAQIEIALEITHEMHTTAMRLTKPGIYEYEIAGITEGIARSKNGSLAFPVVFSVHGETLHNLSHHNKMEAGRLAVHDSGAESPLHYAGDITRTFPVDGRFSLQQKQVYEIVLKAQLGAIETIRPGIIFRDVHLHAARILAEGLKGIGLMKGDTDAAVKEGAHALFFPHGIGHMMGLDVHDMENLGEDYVGYDEGIRRSDQFGLACLRLAKELKPGFVVTVEPGLYFIPALITRWRNENKFNDFINYAEVERYRDFGGIRIEDDVLVTKQGHRVLGKPIPKIISEVEEATKDSK